MPVLPAMTPTHNIIEHACISQPYNKPPFYDPTTWGVKAESTAPLHAWLTLYRTGIATQSGSNTAPFTTVVVEEGGCHANEPVMLMSMLLVADNPAALIVKLQGAIHMETLFCVNAHFASFWKTLPLRSCIDGESAYFAYRWCHRPTPQPLAFDLLTLWHLITTTMADNTLVFVLQKI